jgi:hypothetical protein
MRPNAAEKAARERGYRMGLAGESVGPIDPRLMRDLPLLVHYFHQGWVQGNEERNPRKGFWDVLLEMAEEDPR